MGAKSTVKLRKRGIAYKCSYCGRKLMSNDALAAHQRTAHNVVSRRRVRPVQPSKHVILDRAFHKKKLDAEIDKLHECTQIKDTTTTKKCKVEFECPKCFKRFPTYFPARKHIQKFHCVDTHNTPVPPHDPSLITPLRIDSCSTCMQKVQSIESHICINDATHEFAKTIDKARLCVCAACEEWFPNLITLNTHVGTSHSDHVESLFFPTNSEFDKWKNDMEQQTQVTYVPLEKFDSKRYYHCSDSINYLEKSNRVCPSTFVVQEFPKGLQVHFYYKHYNHNHVEYKPSLKYKKFSITSFLKRSEDYNNLLQLKPDEDDLYIQFKALMEGIVVDAAKINIATLKIILGKALEITSVLSNYDEEEGISIINSSQTLTDEQIIKALEEPLAKKKTETTYNNNSINKSQDLKRKNTDVNNEENNVTDANEKRSKLDETSNETGVNENDTPKIVNAFSLADCMKRTHVTNTLVQKLNEESKTDVNDEKMHVNGEPSSFNDSYKDFVVKNFPLVESVSSRTRSKPIFKTRIGQYVPTINKNEDKTKSPGLVKAVDGKSKSLSPISVKHINLEKKVTESSVIDKLANEKTQSITISTKIVEDKTKVLPKIDVVIHTESKTTKTTTNILEGTTKTRGKNNAETINKKSRPSFDKPKVDIEYEVKEREDDCNILILKI